MRRRRAGESAGIGRRGSGRRRRARSAEVRKAAAASLGQLGAVAVDAVGPLAEMAKSRDEEIADAANLALARIAGK